jgi:hypothetical protein
MELQKMHSPKNECSATIKWLGPVLYLLLRSRPPHLVQCALSKRSIVLLTMLLLFAQRPHLRELRYCSTFSYCSAKR